jgi:hypothetical protein
MPSAASADALANRISDWGQAMQFRILITEVRVSLLLPQKILAFDRA